MDKYTQLGTDGSIDVAASANAYAKALTNWKVENEIPAETISEAMNTILDGHPGRIPMPALLSLTVQQLGATPETFKVLSDRVHQYVQARAKAGELFIVKGKNGGCTREAPVKKTA